jgi:hypothetical protein
MSFIELLNDTKDSKPNNIVEDVVYHVIEDMNSEKPAEILRSGGFKIKLITPTSFGTQITFAKRFKESEIKKILKGFSIKFKGDKDIFIIE